MGVGIQDPEGLSHLHWPLGSLLTPFPHPTAAVAAHAMRVDRQEFSTGRAGGEPQLTQRDLKALAVLHRPLREQLVDRRVRRDEGQAIGQFKSAPNGQGTFGANACGADRCLVNQLQSQTRFGTLARLPQTSTFAGVSPRDRAT
jgi:hypothetical protein